MTIYQWLCILGIPSLAATLLSVVIAQIRGVAALKRGVQALLRAQMINDFNKWSERGYAPLYARQNFENLWVQYEALGQNGVIADLHEKFLNLPTDKKEDKNEKVQSGAS